MVVLADLIGLIQKCFPRGEGNGWNIPKMHSLAKMVYYMLKFGSAKGISGQTGERALKEIVKDHAQQTQRRPSTFTVKVENSRYKTQVLEYSLHDAAPRLGLHFDTINDTNPDFMTGEGLSGRT